MNTTKLSRPGITPRPFVEFGRRLTDAVHEALTKDISQEQLGRIFDVSQCAVSSWMRGSKLPPIEKGVKIAKKINVCVEWLYTGKGPKVPEPPNDIVKIARTISQLSIEDQQLIRDLVTLKTSRSNRANLFPNEK